MNHFAYTDIQYIVFVTLQPSDSLYSKANCEKYRLCNYL